MPERGLPAPEERVGKAFGPEAAAARAEYFADQLGRERRERGQEASANKIPAAPAAEAPVEAKTVPPPKDATWDEPTFEKPSGEWKKAA